VLCSVPNSHIETMKGRYTLRLPLTTAFAVLVLALPLRSAAHAQTAVDQVKAANQAIIAAGCAATRTRSRRSLRMNCSGFEPAVRCWAKPNTKTINPGIAKSQRTFTEESVAVYGDIALLVCRSDFISPSVAPR
jgi:hypothetical protein